MALDPNEFDVKRYFHKDVSHKKSYQQVPLLIRLKSKRSVKRTIELIDNLMLKNQLTINEKHLLSLMYYAYETIDKWNRHKKY